MPAEGSRFNFLDVLGGRVRVRLSDGISLSGGLRGDAVGTPNQGGYFGDRETDNGTVSGFAAVTAGIAGALTPSPAEGAPPLTAADVAPYWAMAAAGVALFVYLVGSIACAWLPEPNPDLEDE